jgi:four helix bundle protein
MSNIAEGFERYSRPDFRRFLAIARASAGEVRRQIHLARRLGYPESESYERLTNQCLEISRLLAALRHSNK